jgi:hypothetical protein
MIFVLDFIVYDNKKKYKNNASYSWTECIVSSRLQKNAVALMAAKLSLIEAALALKDLRGAGLPLNIS